MEATKYYRCEEGHIHTFAELKKEFDFGYDQSLCPECGDVMFDNLHAKTHCEEVIFVELTRYEKMRSALERIKFLSERNVHPSAYSNDVLRIASEAINDK